MEQEERYVRWMRMQACMISMDTLNRILLDLHHHLHADILHPAPQHQLQEEIDPPLQCPLRPIVQSDLI